MLTRRLRLRPVQLTDAAVLAAYRSDPSIARYQGWTAPFSVEDATALITEMLGRDQDAPGWSQYAIERREDQRVIGDVGVNLHSNMMQAEIGFTLAADHHGRGYAGEAVGRMLDHLFVDLGLHKVCAECDLRNGASARLLERVGFQQEGLRRSHTFIKDEWTDDLLFGLLADEWKVIAPRQRRL